MKELLTVVSLLLSGALSEAPAPYQPSGWRPSGPAFELPTKAQTQAPQVSQYLPPVDPRNRPTEVDSGVDVSVQGLPTEEQLPIFQVSPINGQQYVGPNFNSDIKGLQNNLQQSQFQLQQEKARQFSRQQQFPANPNAANGLPSYQPPRQFVPQATPTTTTAAKPKQAEPTTESSFKDREELEDKDSLPKKAKISVEVTKQNLQEYPPEIFLSALAQLQLQPQYVPLQQFGQIREQVFLQPSQQVAPQRQVAAGYDGPTHFAALPSVLAQNQLARQQQSVVPPQQTFIQNPALFISQREEQASSPIIVPSNNQEPLPQYQPSQYQPIAQPQLNQEPLPQYQPVVNQYQPVAQPQLAQAPLPQYQPVANQYQPQLNEPVPQYQPVLNQYQPAVQAQEPLPQYQPIGNQYQPSAQPQQYPLALPTQPQFVSEAQPQNVEPAQEGGKNEEESPQYIYQQSYQPQQVYQPQEVYQPQYAQPQIPANQFAAQPQQSVLIPQGQPINYPNQGFNQFYQNQIPQQQYAVPNQFGVEPIAQGEGAFLQSGLDINQEGNDIDQAEEQDNSESDDEQDDGSKATAVATAFGARTQPRVFSQYGVPVTSSRDQNNRGYQTTTESNAEETTEDVPAVAQATAVANPSRNRSAKLKSRRPRPLFTVDRSGHLVLARDQ